MLDEAYELDVGGLRLSDFSDPETGLEDTHRNDYITCSQTTSPRTALHLQRTLTQLLGVSDESEDGSENAAENMEDQTAVDGDRTFRASEMAVPADSSGIVHAGELSTEESEESAELKAEISQVDQSLVPVPEDSILIAGKEGMSSEGGEFEEEEPPVQLTNDSVTAGSPSLASGIDSLEKL
jgi:hypothetical protein